MHQLHDLRLSDLLAIFVVTFCAYLFRARWMGFAWRLLNRIAQGQRQSIALVGLLALLGSAATGVFLGMPAPADSR